MDNRMTDEEKQPNRGREREDMEIEITRWRDEREGGSHRQMADVAGTDFGEGVCSVGVDVVWPVQILDTQLVSTSQTQCLCPKSALSPI